MIRRGCLLIVVLFGAIFAAYLAVLSLYLEWPGNLIAAAFGALFGAIGVSSVTGLLWAQRDARAFARAALREAPADGGFVVAAGPIRPLAAPLSSPLGGQTCVAYEYEVVSQGAARGSKSPSRPCDLAGFAMAASAIDTPHGSVRILGFPLLDEFPQERVDGPAAHARARQYVASTPFEAMQGVGAVKLFSAFDDAVADADGAVRKDFRLNDGDIPFEKRRLRERIVAVGQQVCAAGRYDAAKRAIVPGGASPNRLWPGTPDQVRRSLVAGARSQAKFGMVFFAIGHAMLGAGLYLSETRHAREPEQKQASAIRLAVQHSDVAALERAVRRGANPNARDAFGDAVLLDVRDPAMAEALLRLGADPDVRHQEDGDTPLIRAARMGNMPLVLVLLAAHADVDARTTRGETALSEAIRGEHAEVAALLRERAEDSVAAPVERPSADVEAARPGQAPSPRP
jgi:hypothetical protein